MKTGDVVLAVDGIAVNDMQALNYRIATHKAGDGPSFKVSKRGKIEDVTIKLELPPENPPRDTTTIAGRNPMTGAKVANLSPAVATDLQMNIMAKGVVVISRGDSIAAQQGFQPGDIVESVNGQDVTSVRQLKTLLEAARGHWVMSVNRGGQKLTLRVDG